MTNRKTSKRAITPPQTFIEKCYKDKSGAVVLGQSPNLPIIVWIIARIALFLIPEETTLFRLLDIVAFGALFTWAWLELFQGATYLRRAMGLLVFIAAIYPQLYPM